MPYPDHFGTDFGQSSSVPQNVPRYKIAFVHGEKGVDDFVMGPNSSIILGDDTDKQRLWIVTTDDLGYKTKRKIRYEIEPEPSIEQPKNDIDDLKNEIKILSEKVVRLEELINGSKSNNIRNGKPKSQPTDSES